MFVCLQTRINAYHTHLMPNAFPRYTPLAALILAASLARIFSQIQLHPLRNAECFRLMHFTCTDRALYDMPQRKAISNKCIQSCGYSMRWTINHCVGAMGNACVTYLRIVPHQHTIYFDRRHHRVRRRNARRCMEPRKVRVQIARSYSH